MVSVQVVPDVGGGLISPSVKSCYPAPSLWVDTAVTATTTGRVGGPVVDQWALLSSPPARREIEIFKCQVTPVNREQSHH